MLRAPNKSNSRLSQSGGPLFGGSGGEFGEFPLLDTLHGLNPKAVSDIFGDRLGLDYNGLAYSCYPEELREWGQRRVVNLLSFSEDFSNAAWTKTRTNITSDASGGFDKLYEDSTSSASHFMLLAAIPQVINGESYIAAIDVMPDDQDWIQLSFSTAGFGSNVWANFNVATGAIGNKGAGSTAMIGEQNSDGSYRCYLHGVASGSGDGSPLAILTNNTDSATRLIAFNGDGSSGVLIDKFMLENSTGRGDLTTPSEYVSVGVLSDPWHGANCDSVKNFDYLNPLTVTDNIVTNTGIRTPITTSNSVLDPRGYMAEGAATNIGLYAKDFTNAAWVATNITPLMDAVGIKGTPNDASTLTATAGNGTIFQTVTKSSSDHTAVFWVKRKTGTGTIEITTDGGSTYTDITSGLSTTQYLFFKTGTITGANPSYGFRIVTSGDEIEVGSAADFDGTWSYSPFDNEGSTKTRPADTEATLDGFDWSTVDAAGSMELRLTPLFDEAAGTVQGVVTPDSSAAARLLSVGASTTKQLFLFDGTTIRTLNPAWSTITQEIKIKAHWGNGTMRFAVYDAATGALIGMSASTAYDGSFNPSGAFTLFKSLTHGCVMKSIQFYKHKKTLAWLGSTTVTNSGATVTNSGETVTHTP